MNQFLIQKNKKTYSETHLHLRRRISRKLLIQFHTYTKAKYDFEFRTNCFKQNNEMQTNLALWIGWMNLINKTVSSLNRSIHIAITRTMTSEPIVMLLYLIGVFNTYIELTMKWKSFFSYSKCHTQMNFRCMPPWHLYSYEIAK